MKELYPNNNFSFIQDSAPSHRAKILQNFLLEESKSRFVANLEWPLSCPNCNLLDYYFWNEVKEKWYSGYDLNILTMKRSIKTGFSLCTTNVLQMLNHFVKQGNSFYHV